MVMRVRVRVDRLLAGGAPEPGSARLSGRVTSPPPMPPIDTPASSRRRRSRTSTELPSAGGEGRNAALDTLDVRLGDAQQLPPLAAFAAFAAATATRGSGGAAAEPPPAPAWACLAAGDDQP